MGLDTQFLAAMLDSAPIGISVGRQGRIIYANAACARMFGYDDPDDLLGVGFMDLIAPECAQDVLERYAARVNGLQEAMEYECVGIRRDGSRFPYRVHSGSFEFEDGPGTFVFLVDLSEHG